MPDLSCPAAEALVAIGGECLQADWDGYGALPVAPETLRNARRFLDALPPDVPAPSIGAEPDGHVTFEWHQSPNLTLSVSVSPEAVLHYAGLFGRNKASGTKAFFGQVPDDVLELVRRVYPA